MATNPTSIAIQCCSAKWVRHSETKISLCDGILMQQLFYDNTCHSQATMGNLPPVDFSS